MFLNLHKKSKRAIRLSLACFLYLVFGALTFGYFEHDADLDLRMEIKEAQDRLQFKYNFSKVDFEQLETIIIDSIPYDAGHQWQFVGSLFFSAIVITTVGYGHSCPNTPVGKLFYIIFALIGIPLGLITFQSTGERINNFAKFCLLKFRYFLSKFGIYVLKEVKARHLLMVSLSLGILTIMIGTLVFHKQESWSLFDSFYYCVITLSTIGLGDRVAAQTNGRLENDPIYVLFTLFFILCGLAIFSACINLLILEFMASNKDNVTAKSRIRRLLQRSSSFKSATFNSFSSLTGRNQKCNNKRKLQVTKEPTSKSPVPYVSYRQNPIKFSVRRPASIYIDHLVNTQANKI